MPRNAKGQFTSGSDMAIYIPSLAGLYKILIIAILIFPWYIIIRNRDFGTTLFNYLIGRNTTESQCKLVDSMTFKTMVESIKEIDVSKLKCPECKCKTPQ